MCVESDSELQALLGCGRIVRRTLESMRVAVRAGVTTAELDAIGESVLRKHGARSAPMLVYKFPAATCISVDDEVVHGIPRDRELRPGDLVKLDVTAEKDGFMTDAAMTVSVGSPTPAAHDLIACSERAFAAAMRCAVAGSRLNEIGRAVSSEVRRSGLTVIRGLDGHGIGRTIHEEPRVPNVYEPELIQRLRRGLVLAVEPMVTNGSGRVVEDADGWTVRTADGALSAHFEQTIVVMDGAPLLLTAA